MIAGPCLAAGLLLAPLPVQAGGGPENVFLVYNSASAESAEIARYYAQLRRIPDCNMLGLPWRGSPETIRVEEFRQALLSPLLAAIDARRLSRQIDYVVYSSGFPWRVRLHGDLGDRKPSKATAPFASLTGATYLFQFIRSKSPTVVGLRTNWYTLAKRNLQTCANVAATPSRGFRAQRFWRPDGKPVAVRKAKNQSKDDPKPNVALNYLLSTMLAVTTKERGNTVAEVKAYLQRSARADATHPDGTFYFARSKDVRSTTRHACYPSVIDELRSLGAKGEQLTDGLTSGEEDALGLMIGSRTYNLGKAGFRFAPGAIGDNLTSYGGVFLAGSSQTPLTEMLRHGAAGASGTVFEPLALQAKFALPTLFLHYRRGCSLAESYYQSVASPYQLLIVGDPLCQPWSDPPSVAMPGFQPGKEITEPFRLKPTITPSATGPARAWDLFIDGRLLARLPATAGLQVNPRSLPPGRHEVRAVAIGGGPIETQGRWISTFVVPDANPQRAPKKVAPKKAGG